MRFDDLPGMNIPRIAVRPANAKPEAFRIMDRIADAKKRPSREAGAQTKHSDKSVLTALHFSRRPSIQAARRSQGSR